MLQVPVVRRAVFCAVLAHWRNSDAVRELEAAKSDGIEQVAHRMSLPIVEEPAARQRTGWPGSGEQNRRRSAISVSQPPVTEDEVRSTYIEDLRCVLRGTLSAQIPVGAFAGSDTINGKRWPTRGEQRPSRAV